MLGLGLPELLIIAAVVLLLFGYKKLPDATRAVGRSLRIFRGEIKGMSEDEVASKEPAQTTRGPLGGTAQPPASPPHAAQPPASPPPAPQQSAGQSPTPSTPSATPAATESTPPPAAPAAEPRPDFER